MIPVFKNPWLLFLIIPAAAFILAAAGMTLRKPAVPRGSKRTAAVLRLLAVSLVITGIAGPQARRKSDSTTTIFVVDASDSMAKSRQSTEQLLKNAQDLKRTNDRIGIVAFGANAAVEQGPEKKPAFYSLQSKVNSSFTNIEQGLKLASSMMPSGDRKRVVIVSDGGQNAGDAQRQVRLLRQRGIVVDVYPVSREEPREVQLKELKLPETLRENERFEMSIRVDSTVRTSAVIRLYADKELAGEKRVNIQEGMNSFVFSDIARKAGMVAYSAYLEPDADTVLKNNSASAFSYIEGKAAILAVEGRKGGTAALAGLLGGDIDITVCSPESLPQSLEELQKYDAFIISDVPADRMSDRFMESLEAAVRHQGKGLLVTGGENSYAPGGYFKTQMEKLLPVNMDIKSKEEHPNLGLVLVIDKSGSMSEGRYGVTKAELAKEAAIRSTEALGAEDMIGVIAFDSSVQWAVKMQKPDNIKEIQDSIGTIRPAGGTQILPPLEEAYRVLKDADTKLKHIILLTDGQAEKSGYERIVENIREAGITLSTVAVGESADGALLQALAEGGKGRYYATDEFTDIPKIFTKETFLAGKTYLNNRTFTPRLSAYSEILKGIDSVPQLDGYVGTSPKSAARVIFSSDRDEPVLAAWQYGLGRTAAWTPDIEGRWSAGWFGWDNASRFWRSLVSWTLQSHGSEGYSIKGGMKDGTGFVELQLEPGLAGQDEEMETVMVSPSGREIKTELKAAEPGIYRGQFDAGESGVYIASITAKKDGEVVRAMTWGISVPYSPEYDISGMGSGKLLQTLAGEGGGKVITDPSKIMDYDVPPVTASDDITVLLLAAALLLFLCDIAVRRLNIDIGARLIGVRLKPAFMRAVHRRAAVSAGRPVVEREKPASGHAAAGSSASASKNSASADSASSASGSSGTGNADAAAGSEGTGMGKKSRTDMDTRSHIDILLERKKKREQ